MQIFDMLFLHVVQHKNAVCYLEFLINRDAESKVLRFHTCK